MAIEIIVKTMGVTILAGEKKINLSPCASHILELLKDGEYTPTQLEKLLPFAERTIQYGLKRLQNSGMVDTKPDLHDLRRTIYFSLLQNYSIIPK